MLTADLGVAPSGRTSISLILEAAREQVVHDPDGDYKDHAAELCNAVRDVLDARECPPLDDMPDGLQCPRAFMAWYGANA